MSFAMNKGKRAVEEEEEDEEPLQIERTTHPNDHTISLCLLGKLWTSRSYNIFGLMETMKKLWSPRQGMVCRELGNNLISFQFNAKRDLERVLAMEPWHFNKHVLVLKPVKGDIQPSMIEFNKTPFWMRLYDVPMIGRTDSTIRQIASRFGEFLELDQGTVDGLTRSVRLRILLDLKKPIKKGTKIRVGTSNPCWLPVTYERLPTFCYYCGHLGHSHKDCEQLNEHEEVRGETSDEQLPFGDWMRASPLKLRQNLTERASIGRGEIRRPLFKTDKGEQDHDIDPKGDSSVRSNANKVHTERHISELLHSMEKVEVSKEVNLSTKLDTKSPTNNHHTPNPHPIKNLLHPIIPPQKPLTPNLSLTHNPIYQDLNPKTPHQDIQLLPKTKNTDPNLLTMPTYTPTSVLIDLVKNMTKTTTKPTEHTPSPHSKDPTNKQKTPDQNTKIPDPKLYHGVQSRMWKRQNINRTRSKETPSQIGGKRKEDPMDLDEATLGDGKKLRGANSKNINSTVEAVVQPRRAS